MVELDELEVVKAKLAAVDLTLHLERRALVVMAAQRDAITRDFRDSVEEAKRLDGALVEKTLLCDNLLFANMMLLRHAQQLMAENLALRMGRVA
ncbi:hypothetical protein [Chromobacterium haemolyticum]|uniref:hypothetical protein n=1 Tax=Chromobacterium haemolyticum TaxID=394935 RepID=UPI0024487204|nr:hypothetical protein [Chromobacterium haemolyticum]MDH0342868.1 hypothetical protein [Chromobacterium haemolyticum]